MYDYINIADRNFLKANEDHILNDRLIMKQHKIIYLADNNDAFTKRYVSSRIQAFVDADIEMRSRIDRSERHQRKIGDTDFESAIIYLYFLEKLFKV